MAVTLTDAQRALLDGKNFAYLATIDANGAPQVTPVWIEYDGTHVRFNTEEKRAKTRHLRNNPRVAICVSNAENPYHYIEIRGTVAEITREGADEMINRLSRRYFGKDYPYNQPGDVRLLVKVTPERVFGMGG
ncbi:MAG: PPOX class F420-dependent oxidoreductase [Polyangiaceae bacterium]|nr:PPOX class F420-dependent oxidoreductase [Polyangiaceae bacterium]